MTKEEFMKKLEASLQDVSFEERQSAMHYYEEYFEEAGVDEDAVERLESPDQIAKAIKEDLDIRLQMVRSSLEGREREYKESKESERSEEPQVHEESKSESGGEAKRNEYEEAPKHTTAFKNGWSSLDKKTKDILIAIAIGVVVLSFISNGFHYSFGFPFFGVHNIFGWIFALLSVIIGLTIAGYAMTLGGIILFIISIITMFVSVLHGLFLMGASLLLVGMGTFFIAGTLWFWSTLVPKWINAIREPFRRQKDNGRGASL